MNETLNDGMRHIFIPVLQKSDNTARNQQINQSINQELYFNTIREISRAGGVMHKTNENY